MARIALLVAVGDWLTKAVAARTVAGDPVVLGESLRFAVVHNDGAVLGWSAGAWTWELNLVLTLAAILLMVPVTRDLARIDKAAPRALGLIVGGALGNLASLLLPPPGVVDFISIGVGARSEIVVNVADVAAYAGLAMIARTGFLIVAEIRRSARVSRTDQAVGLGQRSVAFTDREVSLPVAYADRAQPAVDDVLVPRPESVRRAELADVQTSDPKVIDIRPHLGRARE